MRLVLVGPPGAGKGTQAQYLAEEFDVPNISTGDIFRANVRSGTRLGNMARSYLDAGDLVPDHVTNSMVRDRLGEPDAAHGFLLDGFPRNVAQAYELDSMLSDLGCSLDVVIQLVVDDDEVVKRLSHRLKELQRHDDEIETVRHRLDVYSEQTAPLLQFYSTRKQLVEVSAVGTIDAVTRRAISSLKPYDRRTVGQPGT